MAFRLKNAPAAFMDLMNRVFKEYLDKFVIVFIYDIFVYSKTEADHQENLRIVLKVLRKEGLYAKFSICEFLLTEVRFLGHIVRSEGILVEAVVNWERQKTQTEVRTSGILPKVCEGFLKDFRTNDQINKEE